jgi:putative ABC transport system permease protein
MKTLRITLRLLGQDWRSGELYLLAAALILTVAAITAVGFLPIVSKAPWRVRGAS